jgi:hypothetical protein
MVGGNELPPLEEVCRILSVQWAVDKRVVSLVVHLVVRTIVDGIANMLRYYRSLSCAGSSSKMA